MPIEIYNKEEFLKIAERAYEIRVKKYEDKKIAKVKARTRRYLYTIKVPIDELDDLLQKFKDKNIVYL